MNMFFIFSLSHILCFSLWIIPYIVAIYFMTLGMYRAIYLVWMEYPGKEGKKMIYESANLDIFGDPIKSQSPGRIPKRYITGQYWYIGKIGSETYHLEFPCGDCGILCSPKIISIDLRSYPRTKDEWEG